jgi:hypothetical protein
MKQRLVLIVKIKFLASTWFDIYHSFASEMFCHKTLKKFLFITHQTNLKALRKQNWQITGMIERKSKGWVRKKDKEKSEIWIISDSFAKTRMGVEGEFENGI